MSEKPTRSGASILVVEDNEDAREALIKILEINGYSAAPAGNGREALEYLENSPLPKLIILDLQMPEMDGWQFRAAQKKDPRLSAVPVIVCTAFSEPGIEADEVVIKPVDIRRLLRVISRHVQPERINEGTR
jgi:CheY-like chemotaxis protein